MVDDNSLEFDMFEDMRRRLVEVLVSEGRERLIAFLTATMMAVEGHAGVSD